MVKRPSSLEDVSNKIGLILNEIYSNEDAQTARKRLLGIIEKYGMDLEEQKAKFSEKDTLLIAYGDSIRKNEEKPLNTLKNFFIKELSSSFSFIHILPFFPFSSDDGFSVMDYKKVNPQLGSWKDIEELGEKVKLMFDFVLNHISAQSEWFKKYLACDQEYKSLAIETDPQEDLSSVARPRALPLLTKFSKNDESIIYLWTTFSKDQIDLNYKSIDVLIKMTDVLMFYLKKGASMIRLDAIAYLWKERESACIHLKEAYLIVKLIRILANAVKNNCIILTETNVPYKENMSYFGNGYDEAHMIYNFTLPPLLLHTFLKQDTSILTEWAKTLCAPSTETTFLNFTASHDGIGVFPLKGIVSKEDIENLIEHVEEHGGRVSYKAVKNGKIPYELNISYIDAVAHKKDSTSTIAKRFLASQSIVLVLPGIPAVYIHSILGSRNWEEGVRITGRARSINRGKLNLNIVERELLSKNSLRSKIFYPYKKMLSIRRMQPAFHPNAEFKVLNVGTGIFGVKRYSGNQTIYAFTNVSEDKVSLHIRDKESDSNFINILNKNRYNHNVITLEPFEICWLERY